MLTDRCSKMDLLSKSPEETFRIGEILAEGLAAGDVVALTGELGPYALRFQPALSETQLGQIDYAGGALYCTPEGYLRAFAKRTLMLLR